MCSSTPPGKPELKNVGMPPVVHLTKGRSFRDPTFTCLAHRADARDRVRQAALLLTYVGTIALQTRSLMRLLAPRDLACVRADRFACEGYVCRVHGDHWKTSWTVFDRQQRRCPTLVAAHSNIQKSCARISYMQILGAAANRCPLHSCVPRGPVRWTKLVRAFRRPVWQESVRTRCEIINAVGEMMIVILLAPGAHPNTFHSKARHPVPS